MNLLSVFENYYQPNTSCLLESVSVSEKIGRYSIVATRPEFIFRSWGNLIQINDSKATIGDPIFELNRIFEERRIEYDPLRPPFTGGAIGYIGYDTVRLWEDIGQFSHRDVDIPDIYLLFYNDVIVYDHFLDRVYKFGRPDQDIIDKSHQTYSKADIKPDLSREKFLEMIGKAKEYISCGDIYQANISQRFHTEADVNGWDIYKHLRDINPSPFAGYMNLDGLEIISCSPERLVRVQGDKIETRPIAGTYPRGRNTEEDKILADRLVLNPKERAEHIMLVDLERNDLGKVCKYGSINVDESMVVETYSHVHHIVSNVSGTVCNNVSQMDILKAVFPGGTITGCPKIRCMQIIDELEPVRRNVYTGSMGWIGYNGNMDLNIAIRTIVKKGRNAYFNVGAGIVADSIPEKEYNETLHKAGAMIEALASKSDCKIMV
jgi:para-aminobenzoate synthetase component 1